jgi:hypothetical protein
LPTAVYLFGCSSTQFANNWIQEDESAALSGSTVVDERFARDSKTCIEQAEAIKESERIRREAPRDQTNPDLLLEFDLEDIEDSWNSVYERCLESLGWKKV